MPIRARIGRRDGSQLEDDVAWWAPVEVDALTTERRAASNLVADWHQI